MKQIENPDFLKNTDQLIPAIVQDANTHRVLMLGYMNDVAFQQTIDTGWVTFYSRSRKEIWVKGATSGNRLQLISWALDCDRDSILIKAHPSGPVCHTGADTCFNEQNEIEIPQFLRVLEQTIEARIQAADPHSYTSRLVASGINKVAQKVGEEAVELIIEAKDNQDDLFRNEAADLLFHYLILLQMKGFRLKDVVQVLESRHRK